MRKITFLITILVLLLVASGICAAQDWEPKMKDIAIYSGSMGGGWHTVAAITASILEEHIPGVVAKAAPGGGAANPRTIQAKKGLLGFTFAGTAYEARNALGDYEEPHEDLRHVISIWCTSFFWATRKNSDIYSIPDLVGKRISPGRTGQVGLLIATKSLEAYGITFDDIEKAGGTVNLLGDADRFDMLRDRHLDAVSNLMALNFGPLLAADAAIGVRVFGFDEEKIDYMQKEIHGLAKVKVPANTWSDEQTEPIYTVSIVTTLIAHKDVEDELIYRIVDAMIQEHERYNDFFPKESNMLLTPLAGAVIPVHPGAKKYYEEKGFVK